MRGKRVRGRASAAKAFGTTVAGCHDGSLIEAVEGEESSQDRTGVFRPLVVSIANNAYHRRVAMIEELGPAVALFHSLADRTRLAIVRRLAHGEARVVDLTGELGLAQSTVSKHLACLRDCGLVDFRAEARQSFYSLTRPELIDLLAAAEGVLAATGSAVALCPVYGQPANASGKKAATR